MFEDSVVYELKRVVRQLYESHIEKSVILKFIKKEIVEEVFKDIDIQEKVRRTQKALENRTEFILTEEHIALMKRFYVDWQEVEHGAPEIDPKRPYGNSDVIGDILKIMKKELTESQCIDLHRETRFALQILLQHGEVKLGMYKRDSMYTKNWEKVK